MDEIILPRLAQSRATARRLFKEHAQNLTGQAVVLNCREQISGSPSFADELVKIALTDGGATELIVKDPGPDFRKSLSRSAEFQHVGERLHFIMQDSLSEQDRMAQSVDAFNDEGWELVGHATTRPRLDVSLSVRFTPNEMSRVRTAARRQGITVYQYIHKIVLAWCEADLSSRDERT